MELFTSDTSDYKMIRSLEELSVNDIKELIFNKVYGIKYVNRSRIVDDKDIKQYRLDENKNKVVYIYEENDVKDYRSLVLVHYTSGEARFVSSVNSDMKRFNNILREFMQF